MADEYAIVINVELSEEEIEELAGDGDLYEFMSGVCQNLFGDFDLRVEKGAM